MKNFVQEGRIIRATAPYDRLSGQGAKIGSLFGVACHDVLNTIVGSFQVEGVFDLTKASGQAWTEGALIYWDDSAKNATNTSNTGANKLIGIAGLGNADVMAQSADVIGRVRLNDTAVS